VGQASGNDSNRKEAPKMNHKWGERHPKGCQFEWLNGVAGAPLMAEMATRNRKRKLSEISQNNGKTAR